MPAPLSRSGPCGIMYFYFLEVTLISIQTWWHCLSEAQRWALNIHPTPFYTLSSFLFKIQCSQLTTFSSPIKCPVVLLQKNGGAERMIMSQGKSWDRSPSKGPWFPAGKNSRGRHSRVSHAVPCRAAQDAWVMVESAHETWSTAKGNGRLLRLFPASFPCSLSHTVCQGGLNLP